MVDLNWEAIREKDQYALPTNSQSSSESVPSGREIFFGHRSTLQPALDGILEFI
jgi:hypothetical protein